MKYTWRKLKNGKEYVNIRKDGTIIKMSDNSGKTSRMMHGIELMKCEMPYKSNANNTVSSGPNTIFAEIGLVPRNRSRINGKVSLKMKPLTAAATWHLSRASRCVFRLLFLQSSISNSLTVAAAPLPPSPTALFRNLTYFTQLRKMVQKLIDAKSNISNFAITNVTRFASRTLLISSSWTIYCSRHVYKCSRKTTTKLKSDYSST